MAICHLVRDSRISITEKLSLLYLLCFEKKLSPKDKIYKLVRKVFDERNSLVHPKTREVRVEKDNSGQLRDNQPKNLMISESMEILEFFILNISNEDPDIKMLSCFEKPTKKDKYNNEY